MCVYKWLLMMRRWLTEMQGTLDLLVQRTGKEKISFVQNNFFYDAFFLRAIGTI